MADVTIYRTEKPNTLGGTWNADFSEFQIPSAGISLTAAGIINAFGITFFLYPVHLYDPGISGLSMLLAQITPDFMTLSFFLVLLNLPLFLYGYKKMGLSFSIRSVFPS